MSFQIGQLVQCKRALHPGHTKLVGCIGEIKVRLGDLEAFLYNCEYVVFFPNYPEGYCPYCDKPHNPLHFMMFGVELKPVEDPDQNSIDVTHYDIPEELEVNG